MESALADVEFLARSPNRVDVLNLLADEARTRDELAAETGASQATLGRILTDFRERSWVRRDGAAYEATATGRLVARGFADLLATLDTERDLRDIVDYLPTAELGFDPARLADATITLPTQTRPNAPVSRVVELIRDAESVTVFSHAFNEQSLAAVSDRVAAGESTFRGVFSEDAIGALAEASDLRRRLEALLDAGDADVRVHEDEVPLAVTATDATVHLMLRDADGVLRGSLDTDDPAVREWAADAFERYWRDAEPLDCAALP